MIVLTTGQAAITRLMRADAAARSQHLSPREAQGHGDQGQQADTAAQPRRGGCPPGF